MSCTHTYAALIPAVCISNANGLFLFFFWADGKKRCWLLDWFKPVGWPCLHLRACVQDNSQNTCVHTRKNTWMKLFWECRTMKSRIVERYTLWIEYDGCHETAHLCMEAKHDKCNTDKFIWSVKITRLWKYLFRIEMDKYVPLHALHLSISWPAHLHMYLCRFLRGLSHTAGVSECHGFSVWICASLCLVLLGMSMCVCKCARVCQSVFSVYLFSRSFCWCLFLHILYFILCVYICAILRFWLLKVGHNFQMVLCNFVW